MWCMCVQYFPAEYPAVCVCRCVESRLKAVEEQSAAANEKSDVTVLPASTSVSELAAALNRLGVTSRDLVVIFQALKRQGALHARLEIL